jgi:hypothetical protein
VGGVQESRFVPDRIGKGPFAVPWPFMLFELNKNKTTVVTLLGVLFLCFALLITLQYVRPLPATIF